jgi:hypothetical protein
MKTTTWNKLWSKTEKEQSSALARSVSIHPSGKRNARHQEKNRVRKAQHR